MCHTSGANAVTVLHKPVQWMVILAFTLISCTLSGNQSPNATSARPDPKSTPSAPSATSQRLAKYYGGLQDDLLASDLLRRDGGGPDTPYTASTLENNFKQLAFYDEYARGKGFLRSSGKAGRLRRWTRPVRLTTEFGASVSSANRAKTNDVVTDYVIRLAKITGHDISISEKKPNFHVFFMGEDDRAQLISRVKEIIPNINRESIAIFENLPRSIHCLVFAFSGRDRRYEYTEAIALIRSEHPELMQKSCIHEELAQGLGLANDSPYARPSIFNDDDEFATLTRQDELFLKMLYHPTLQPGMSIEAAQPIVQKLAEVLIQKP